MGVVETIDLVPNGSKITVTHEKLEEYLVVQLQVYCIEKHPIILYLMHTLVSSSPSCETSALGVFTRIL